METAWVALGVTGGTLLIFGVIMWWVDYRHLKRMRDLYDD